MDRPILVTGASGNTGRHVVDGLLAEGRPVRALTRDPARAALPPAAEVVTGDVTVPDDVAAAARGASAAYLVWPGTDDEAAGAAEVVEAFARHLDRIVYLSAAEPESGVWGRVEAALRRSVGSWTFLRVTGLAVNALGWTDQLGAGSVRAPFGRMRRSLVHERDVAAVAVRALIDDGHAGRAYVLTGPEAISQSEQARVIGEEIGRPVRWEEQPEDEARRELSEHVGAEFADKIVLAWREAADVPEPVSDDVERVLGRPPRPFRQWARDHRAEFAPGADE